MTCIVGVEHKGHVYLGSDSAMSDGHFTSVVDVPKIFTIRDITFGYTTSFRFADLLQYELKLPPQEDLEDRQYLITVVIKHIRECLKTGGFATINNNREQGGTALMVFKQKLYTLQDEFSIIRDIGGYAACGSGTNFALGSLASTAGLAPEKRVELALNAAIKHCCTVSGPIHQVKI